MEFIEALPTDGERRLMLAVLIDAVRSISASHAPTPHLLAHREILKERAWFNSEDSSNTFSFQYICDSLGLNADYIRRRVLRRRTDTQSIRVRRYAAKAEESWTLQRKGKGRLTPTEPYRHRATRSVQTRSAMG